MAKRVFGAQNWTPIVVADGSAMTNGAYQAIGASAATAGLLVYEIYEGGEASASAINGMVFARDSTLMATPATLVTPNTDGPMNTLTAAAAVGSITAVSATTPPIRTNVVTSAKLHLSFNSFGGIVRWVAAPGEEWGIIGVTASISESSLSAGYGSPGAMSSHIVYEAY